MGTFRQFTERLIAWHEQLCGPRITLILQLGFWIGLFIIGVIIFALMR